MHITHRRRARSNAVFLSLMLSVVLTACSNGSDEAVDHNKQDVEFAQDMIVHHSQALEMAKLAPAKAESERVKTLAGKIEGAQQPEIDTMNAWLQSWGEDAVDPSSSGADHAAHGSSMPGVMTEDDMKRLESLNGPAFDKAFLEMMIEHHTGAIEMAGIENEQGKNLDAKVLAQSIATSQQAEINEMRDLLTQSGR
jgi:uncharacterized protein (DUF305 family)